MHISSLATRKSFRSFTGLSSVNDTDELLGDGVSDTFANPWKRFARNKTNLRKSWIGNRRWTSRGFGIDANRDRSSFRVILYETHCYAKRRTIAGNDSWSLLLESLARMHSSLEKEIIPIFVASPRSPPHTRILSTSFVFYGFCGVTGIGEDNIVEFVYYDLYLFIEFLFTDYRWLLTVEAHFLIVS